MLIYGILYLGITLLRQKGFFLLYARAIPLRTTHSNKLSGVCRIRTVGVMSQTGHCNFKFLDG